MEMDKFILDIKKKAKILGRRIIFPEGEEERVLSACKILEEEGIVSCVLVGNKTKIEEKMNNLGFRAEVRDPNKEDTEKYAKELYELRKHKGMSIEGARGLIKNNEYFSTMLLYKGEVDGLVSGSTHTTADTLRPALQIIKTKEDIKTASSFFFMLLKKKIFLFGDCALNINPNSEQLAEIAFSTAMSARFFNIEPNLAFLSFSTKGSAEHESIDKVKEAVKMMNKFGPDFRYDGELQVDAAIVPEVAKRKSPNSVVKGEANILIFPDLNSGNIGYKLVQRLAGAKAIGPIVQGLKKPVNDLSRGCNVEDIVIVAAITAIQSEGKK